MILEDVLFFGMSVGYTMGWTALSSELGTLKALHGANVLLFLNIAYFAPSLPILVTQLVWDPGWNRKYGAARATLYRQCVALPICFLCTIALPYLSWDSLPTLITISAIIGTAASLAFGSSSQLVARFPPSCGQALALGIVSSGPIVLLLQFCLKLGPHPTFMQQVIFFHTAGLFPLLALYCVIRLLWRYWTPLQAGNVLLPFTRAVQAADNSANAGLAPVVSIAANAIPYLAGQLSSSTGTIAGPLTSSNLESLPNGIASSTLLRRTQGSVTDAPSSLSSSALQQQPQQQQSQSQPQPQQQQPQQQQQQLQQPAQPQPPLSTLSQVLRAPDTGLTAPLLPPALAPPSAPAIPSTIVSQDDTEDAESLIVGELSLPDPDPHCQDTTGLIPDNPEASVFLRSHQVLNLSDITSAILPDAFNTPLLASYAVSGAISDSVQTSLVSDALPYLHITLPETTEVPEGSQHPLLAPAPLAVDVPWSPTGSLPGGAPIEGGSFLENLAATAGADQADVEPGRQVVVNSQYVSDVVEASSFWLTHVGTPREGAIFVSSAPQESAITTALLPPAESLLSDSLPRRTDRPHPSTSLTPSLIAAAAETGSGLPQVAPMPVPPTALAPQRTSIIGGSSLKSVTWNIAPLALCLFSSVTVSVMLFPVFTVVRSSGTLGCMLPQALFAARMVSDIMGRILASAREPPLGLVGTVAILKASMLPIALFYLWQPPKFLSDIAALIFVVFHWVLSGLVGAWSFMLLPNFFSGPESAAYAGTVMSGAYQFGTIAGLILATLLEYVFVPPSAHLTPMVC